MTSRVVLSAVLILTGASLALPSYAAGPDNAPAATHQKQRAEVRDKAVDRVQDALAKLNLTDEQKSKIHDLVSDYQTKEQAFRTAHEDQLKTLAKDQRAASKAHDEAKLKDLRAQRKELSKDAPQLRDLVKDISQTLTPDQRKELHESLKANRPAAAAHHEKADKATK